MVDNGELIVDASDPNFVIVPKQDTGIVDNVDGATYIGSYTYVLTEKGYSPEEITAAMPELVPVLNDGCINFPVQTLLLQWPEAPEDSSYGTDPESWYIGESNGCLVLPGGKYVEPWTLLGEATFTDNILAPSFGETVAPYAVNLYKSNETEGLYKVEDPWKGIYDVFGFGSTSPSIELDAIDPANVFLDLTSTGINGGEDGNYYILSYSSYCMVSEMDPEELTATERITLETGEEVIDDESYDVLTFRFAPESSLIYAYSSREIYIAGDGENDSTIVLKTKKDDNSGISNVNAADTDAPVRYYNLLGVEVAKPAAGNVVIRVQGGKATKILAK